MKIKVQPKIFRVDMSQPLLMHYCSGRVHAGNPSQILDERTDVVDMREYMKFRPYESVLGIEVVGDSMRGSGIFEGDVALFKEDSIPENGDLVVATVNGECSLKEFYRKDDGHISLVPTNKCYDPIEVDETMDLYINGVVVNVLKNSFR